MQSKLKPNNNKELFTSNAVNDDLLEENLNSLCIQSTLLHAMMITDTEFYFSLEKHAEMSTTQQFYINMQVQR